MASRRTDRHRGWRPSGALGGSKCLLDQEFPAPRDQSLQQHGLDRRTGQGFGPVSVLRLEPVPRFAGGGADRLGRAQERGRPLGLTGGRGGGRDPFQAEPDRGRVGLPFGPLEALNLQSLSASQVPPKNTSTWKPTNVTTPRYLPTTSVQRGTGLANRTEAALGCRNSGRKPAVHTSASSSPADPATHVASNTCSR